MFLLLWFVHQVCGKPNCGKQSIERFLCIVFEIFNLKVPLIAVKGNRIPYKEISLIFFRKMHIGIFSNFVFYSYFFWRGWGRSVQPPFRKSNFQTCNKVETYTRDTPWQKKLIDDVIIFVTWPRVCYKPERIFADISKIRKMTSPVYFIVVKGT